MRAFVRKLPFPVEFAVVLGGAFGYALVISLIGSLIPAKGPFHSEPGLWRTVGVETLQFLVIGGFLWLRGWNSEKLGLNSHWSDGAWGLGLAIVSYMAFYAAYVLISAGAPGLAASTASGPHLPAHLSPWVVGALVLFSPFFEEFFVTGYVITALKEKAGESVAVNVSVALRLAYHAYQGVIGVVLLIPVGLIFSYWYARSGKLWPIIVAHAVLNLVSFVPYVKF